MSTMSTRASARTIPAGSPRFPRPPVGGGGDGGGGDPNDPDDDEDDDASNPGLPPVPAAVPAMARPVPIFALTPARAVGGFIDYTSRHGQRLYESTTQKLAMEFDCTSESLRAFVDMCNKRAIESNWKMTTAIQVDGQTYDLFDHYGMLTTKQILDHVNIYVGTNTRNAQNAYQMAECFSNSLTETARTRVASRKEEYTLNGLIDGLLYFKAIIKTASVDTRATTTTLRNKLASLDHHMQEVSSNVSTFIVDVKSWQQSLLARGETTNDLMVNVFRGLKACSDTTFVRYITRKEDDYNEGQDVTVDALLDLAGNKYESLIEAGEFNQPTDEQKKIVALTAQLEKLGKTSKSFAQNKDKKSGKPSKDGQQKSTKKNGKKETSNKDKSSSYPAWKLIPPGAGDPHTKVVNGKTYHWCKYHNMWTIHKASECTKGQTQSQDTSATQSGTGNLRINRNLQAVIEEDESSM